MTVSVRQALAEDVRRGMLAAPRALPPKWLYDDLGSRLFDEICELPEYYLTRAERGLLERHAGDIADRDCRACREVVELGSGMARKTGLLLAAFARRSPRLRYVPVDVSEAALEASVRSLSRLLPGLVIDPVLGDFEEDLERACGSPASPRVFAFLGSTIGNLDGRAAPALCARVAGCMRAGDSFLLGVDLVKPVDRLLRAYDDASGVTARFNKNVLTVMNRVLDADFALESFAHRAHWNARESRVEMHLESLARQRVHIGALDTVIDFARGERVLTEISRKFTRKSVEETLRPSLRVVDWFEAEGTFALVRAELR